MHVIEPFGRDLGSATDQPTAFPTVEVALSAEADLLVLARFAVSTVASRAGFDIEEIDDLRLAVEELCLLVLQGRRTGRLFLAFVADSDRIDVWCNYDGQDEPDDDTEENDKLPGLSGRILDALVDEHGPYLRDGLSGAHLCKRRARPDG